jgi:hypothetical protein
MVISPCAQQLQRHHPPVDIFLSTAKRGQRGRTDQRQYYLLPTCQWTKENKMNSCNARSLHSKSLYGSMLCRPWYLEVSYAETSKRSCQIGESTNFALFINGQHLGCKNSDKLQTWRFGKQSVQYASDTWQLSATMIIA